MNKISVIISVIIVVGVITAAPSYCRENETPTTKTIDGNVVSADWEKSVLTVKWPSESGEIGFEETALFVPDSLEISKGGDTIGLMDVETGDHVIVEYYEDSDTLTTKSITVLE